MADTNGKKTTASKTKKAAETQNMATEETKNLTEKKNTLTASTLPTAEALKDRFKAGSIPLQSDFADLVDMANSGFRATGQAADQNKAGKGMRVSATGQLEPDITSYNFKDDVQGCSPIKVDSSTNKLVVDLYNGLAEFDSGVGVKPGNGITVNTDGVNIDPLTVLPKGIITMFSGTAAPVGWALCDGTNGTPDLRDKFILGGNWLDNGTSGGVELSGPAKNKSYKVMTDQETPGITVSVAETKLTKKQIPPHSHLVNATWNTGEGAGGTTSVTIGNTQIPEVRMIINETGTADGHSHNATATQNSHNHSFTALPAYYIFAFIMKL